MIEIVPYKATWPAEFQEIAKHLRKALGASVLRIDHIGSTAVANLSAKDVIDVQITVLGFYEHIRSTMIASGYSQPAGIWRDHRPPNASGSDIEWDKWFFFPPAGQRRSHIHVRIQGRVNHRYPLLFRDYLREHSAMAQAYAELKRRLAQHLADPQTYTDVKDPAVDLIYLAAEDWAAAIGWQPGLPDG